MKVKLGHDNAAGVVRLLREIGRVHGLPNTVRQDAARWASEIRGRMDRRDVEAVTWVIRDACSSGRLSGRYEREARFWAALLQERI